jgi:co-chaperonin GroES (HSP10)
MIIQHLYTKFDVDMMFCFEVSNGATNHVAQSTSVQTKMSNHLVRVHWTAKVVKLDGRQYEIINTQDNQDFVKRIRLALA